MQKTISLQRLEPELPIDASELEALLKQLGAEVTHPVQTDPVATAKGKIVAFWTS